MNDNVVPYELNQTNANAGLDLDKVTEMKNSSSQNVKDEPEKFNADFKWYCVRTYTSHEERVKRAIEAEVKRMGWESFIDEVIIPLETVYEVRKGKRKAKVRNFLPGYIFIKAIISEERKTKYKILDFVEGLSTVVGFVGRKNDPVPLQESEIERIFGRVAERTNIETIECTFSIGDPIKVIDGPFSGFTGTVTEVANLKQKLKVEVGILGRKTPVELDFAQVQFDKPE